MRIAIPLENDAPPARERRVALVPTDVARLVKAGLEVAVQRGAGVAASFDDESYAAVGAQVVDRAFEAADVLVKVQRPAVDDVARLKEGAAVVSLLQPHLHADVLRAYAAKRVSGFSLERVPRITRAQSMDVLSSQATVAGYKAVVLACGELPKLFPMLTTAAGSLAPARVLVLGAGVAGLQAIATARRMGAVVTAFDVRAAAAEQVKSLGATFLAADLVSKAAEGAGGYAKAQSSDDAARTQETIASALPSFDVVISTAAIPGKPAPVLVTADGVSRMKRGALFVDLAAETGGNCALTKAGEVVVTDDGVRIFGPINLAATVPTHASQMFSKNIATLLEHLVREKKLVIDVNDEITKAMLVVHGGEILARPA